MKNDYTNGEEILKIISKIMIRNRRRFGERTINELKT